LYVNNTYSEDNITTTLSLSSLRSSTTGKRITMSELFEQLNTAIIKRLQDLRVGTIQPYKEDLISGLPSRVLLSKRAILHGCDMRSDNDSRQQQQQRRHLKSRSTTDVNKRLRRSRVAEVNDKMRVIMHDVVRRHVKEGADIADIDVQLYRGICSVGLYPSMLGCDYFPKASSICVNNVVCHAIPYQYQLRDGDIVTLDVCGFNGDFHTDVADTFTIGTPSGHHKKLVSTCRDCLANAVSVCRPGERFSNIGRVVEKTAVDNGFHVLRQFAGHGIGPRLHMPPRVLNYFDPEATNYNDLKMKEGDMFAIEPLLSSGKSGTLAMQLPDKTTYVTHDKSFAAHSERTIMVTGSGCTVLNEFL
jgi:methionyl aminopeptidase